MDSAIKYTVLFFSIIIVSCCPQRLLNTSSRDSISIVVQERVIRLTDTVFLEIPKEVERIITRDTISHLEVQYARSEAMIDSGGYLHHYLEQKAVKQPKIVEIEYVTRDSLVFRDREIEKVVEVKRQPTKFEQFQKGGFWVLLAVVIMFIGFKLLPIIKKFI